MSWLNEIDSAPISAPKATPQQELYQQLLGNLNKLPAKDQAFATSLCSGFKRFGSWSSKQLVWAAKFAGYRAEQTPAPVTVENYLPVVQLFDRGGKQLHFEIEAGPLKLRRTGEGAREPGSISLTDGRPYGSAIWYGTLKRSGELYVSRNCTPDVEEQIRKLLRELAANPAKTCEEQSLKTGHCSCCGRGLTNHTSVTLGIGPVCREKWGF